MGSIADLLSGMCPEIEVELKPNLRGFFGGMIRAYLPQAWVFTTEAETVTLHVDAEGNVSARSGRAASPDVIIQRTHAALLAALGGLPLLSAPNLSKSASVLPEVSASSLNPLSRHRPSGRSGRRGRGHLPSSASSILANSFNVPPSTNVPISRGKHRRAGENPRGDGSCPNRGPTRTVRTRVLSRLVRAHDGVVPQPILSSPYVRGSPRTRWPG